MQVAYIIPTALAYQKIAEPVCTPARILRVTAGYGAIALVRISFKGMAVPAPLPRHLLLVNASVKAIDANTSVQRLLKTLA